MNGQLYTEADVEALGEKLQSARYVLKRMGDGHMSSVPAGGQELARVALDHLVAAGRLLPEGAEMEVIYGSRDRNGHVQSTGPGPIGLANARASLHPVFVELVAQERRRWPDGARFSTPWRRFEESVDE